MDIDALTQAFLGEATAQQPQSQWQNELLTRVSPEQARKKQLQNAVLAASQMLLKTRGSFGQGLANAAGAAGNAWAETGDDMEQQSLDARKAIEDSRMQQRDHRLRNLEAALGIVRGQDETAYNRSRDGIADQRYEDEQATGQDRWQQEYDQNERQISQRDKTRSITGDIEERKAAAVQLGLKPGSREFQQYVLTGDMSTAKERGLSATQLKYKRESENAVVDLGNTITNLEKALELSDNTLSGTGADAMTYIGTKLPYGADLIGEDNAKRAKATADWQQIMNPAAIETMSQTLKGATTDFELNEFKRIMADPTKPIEQKKDQINILLRRAREQLALEQQRLVEFEDEDAPPASAGTSTDGEIQPGHVDGDYRFKGGDPNDPNAWEPVGADLELPPTPEVQGQVPAYQEGQTATKKATGERMIFRGGQWQQMQ